MDRRRSGGGGGGLESDHRTPMAWQHRDVNLAAAAVPPPGVHGMVAPVDPYYDAAARTRTPTSRYGGPSTPAGSRSSRTPEHRRDHRASSSDRYSQQSSARKGAGGNRDARSQTGSRTGSRGTPARNNVGGYNGRPGPGSPGSTTEDGDTTAGDGETTETDSQAPPPDPRIDYNTQMFHPAYAVPMAYAPHPSQMAPAATPALMAAGPIAPPQLLMAPNGSIRSVQSVPMLAAAAAASAAPLSQTWDGEPCPVHHQHPAMPLAALYGMGVGAPHPAIAASMGPSSVPPSIISGATTVRRARSIAEISNASNYPMLSAPATPHFDTKSFHGSMHLPQGMMMHGHPHHPPPPPGTPGPYMITRGGRMVMAENGAPSHLPIRDHTKSPMPPKDHKDHMDDHKKGVACCSGHFVVVWIILGIITFGILLGIVLKFTVA